MKSIVFLLFPGGLPPPRPPALFCEARGPQISLLEGCRLPDPPPHNNIQYRPRFNYVGTCHISPPHPPPRERCFDEMKLLRGAFFADAESRRLLRQGCFEEAAKRSRDNRSPVKIQITRVIEMPLVLN